jgi:hypothetical protein
VNGAILGSNANVTITGGTSGQYLQTNGSGGLSWATVSSSSSTAVNVDTFTGNGVATTFTLSISPASVNNVIVNYNGAIVSRASYSVSGTTLTFGSAPASGSTIEVSTFAGLNTGSSSFVARTYTGDGSTVNFTVTSGVTANAAVVTLDGVTQTPTSDYTISGSTLTFTTAPYTSAAILIRELTMAVASFGSNVSLGNITYTGNISGGNVVSANTFLANGTPVATTGKAIAMAIVFGF